MARTSAIAKEAKKRSLRFAITAGASVAGARGGFFAGFSSAGFVSVSCRFRARFPASSRAVGRRDK